MVTEGHPSYPHPTIQEAICEIIFDMPQDKPWSPLLFGEYFRVFRMTTPHLNLLVSQDYSFSLDLACKIRRHPLPRKSFGIDMRKIPPLFSYQSEALR